MVKKSNIFLLIGDPALREEARERLVARISKDRSSPKSSKSDFTSPDVIARTAEGRPKQSPPRGTPPDSDQPSGLKNFSSSLYHGDEMNLGDFLAQAQTYPFLETFQYLHLVRPEDLPKADLDALALFLPDVPDFTVLICESDGVDQRTSFYKQFAKLGTVEELLLDQAGQAEQNVRRFLSAKGKTIRREAFAELFERLGGLVTLMYQVLDQLVVYAGERKEITQDDVILFSEREISYGPFELTDALLDKDAEKVLTIYRFLLSHEGQDAVEMIGLLHWQIRRLWEVKNQLGEGVPATELARQMRMPPFALRRLISSAGRFSENDIRRASEDLFYLDWQMKTGRVKGNSALEEFLLRWCGGRLVESRINA